MDLGNECYNLREKLKSYFDNHQTSIALKGKGEVREMFIHTPFLLYDGSNLELRLRQTESDTAYHGMKIGEKDGGIILHDNSRLYEYLSSYGINLSSKSEDQKKYRDYVDALRSRNKFGFDENWKWFYFDPVNKNSSEIILFMHSLQRISSLILTKTLRPISL